MLSTPRPSLPSDPGHAVMSKVGSRMWDWKRGAKLFSAGFCNTSSFLVVVNMVHFSVLVSAWYPASSRWRKLDLRLGHVFSRFNSVPF